MSADNTQIEKILKDLVSDYLDGIIDLREFYSEFTAYHWDTRIQWGYEINHYIYWFQDKLITEKQLKQHFQTIIRKVQV